MASRSLAAFERQFLNELDGSNYSEEVDLKNQLLALQWAQLQHDHFYHADIALLPIGDKIKHFALHMAKYVGYVAVALDSEDNALLQRALVDAFVISLACANSLGLDLGKALGSGDDVATIELSMLGKDALAEFPSIATDPSAFLKLMAHHTGRLAKACESLDHIESHPFREAMSTAVLNLFRLVIAKGVALKVDLIERRHERLKDIESKSIFCKYR